MEIKAAIERLSPAERVRLHSLVWPEDDLTSSDTPPDIRKKLAAAAESQFVEGSRGNLDKLLKSLE